MPRTFWVPAVPHTRPTDAFSHCAFTTKTRLLPRLLKLAYPDCTVRYCGVSTDAPEGVDDVSVVMSDGEWQHYFGAAHRDKTAFVGSLANVAHPGYVRFNWALAEIWRARVQPGDVVCFPFGHAHGEAWASAAVQGALPVETGIGYPTPFLPFRIYESYAWMHYVAGKTGCEGSDYHFVAPAYFDPADWKTRQQLHCGDSNEIVYMGRIAIEKGLPVVRAIADAMPDRSFVMYGQGDPTPWEGGNLRYGGVLEGTQRNEVLAKASVVLCPTRYIEPFCQTHVEALLSGTPVIGSVHSIFAEHANRLVAGVFTARTLDRWVHWITRIEREVDARYRDTIAERAREVFALESVAPLYRSAIDTMLETLTPAGWYGSHSHLLGVGS